jgi:hypothetical protein
MYWQFIYVPGNVCPNFERGVGKKPKNREYPAKIGTVGNPGTWGVEVERNGGECKKVFVSSLNHEMGHGPSTDSYR